MARPDRAELIVIAGGATSAALAAADQVAAQIQGARRGTVTLSHHLAAIEHGLITRTLHLGDRVDTVPVRLAHGCVSCTLREDLLPMLRTLCRRPDVHRIVLRLDPVLEPEQVCWAVHHVVVDGAPVADHLDVRGVISVLDAGTWLDDVASGSDVADAGLANLPDDDRTLAQLVVAHAEFADLLVLAGTPGIEGPRLHAVLDRLNPLAVRMSAADIDRRILLEHLPDGARRGIPDDPHGPLVRGAPPLHRVDDVQLVPFTARLPFHPGRLHQAIDVLLDGVIRTRGRIWLATRPEAVLWMESAGGGLHLGHVGEWLATLDVDDEAWRDVDPERQALAALRWHPRWGDRAQELFVLVAGADPDHVDAALRAALLTDVEIAAGEAAWSRFDDPFGFWHEDPCGEADGPAARIGDSGEHDHHGGGPAGACEP